MSDAVREVLSRTGLLAPLQAVRSALRVGRHRRRRPGLVAAYLEGSRTRKLQIGCGANLLQGWLNADFEPAAEGVIFVDARQRLPFVDATFDYVFSEHMLEHIDYLDGRVMLAECCRVLRPGGRLRIATPDLRFLIELYTPQKSDLQRRYMTWAASTFFPEIGVAEDV